MLGIIFDCDGTLIDSEPRHYLSWQEALKSRGGELPLEEYISYVGLSGINVAEHLSKKGYDAPEALLSDKRKVYSALLRQGAFPIERTIRFLRQLIELKEVLGLKIGVASAASKEEILINLEHLGLRHVFDAIVSGKNDLSEYVDPEGVNKPKPYIYLHAAKLLGLDPAQCVAFEDSAPGVRAAASAGLLTFAVPTAYTQHHDFSPAKFIIAPSDPINIHEFFQRIHIIIDPCVYEIAAIIEACEKASPQR